MKNIALGFLLAVVCIFTIATTVPNSIMTIKPSRPVATACFFSNNEYVIKEKIIAYSKEGYIVKTISGIGTQSHSWYRYIVVMEKY